MQSKIERTSLLSSLIALELIALNSPLYPKWILLTSSQCVKNGLKILDTTKTDIFELKFSQSDAKIWKSYCRADFTSV